ncbi:hypothetical protein [Halomonas elongata]|uniref:hypothetical protein n=1 Tax=Halomonas elongata TaxID=2746 RepID=UPI00186B8CB1|nr:hypothetical protein [Halomonas elongata]MBW5800682.1 hypothetical protein [Halomonas elongata]
MSRYADYADNGEIFCIVEGDPGVIDVSRLIEVGEGVSDETHYIDMSQAIYFARKRHTFDTSHSIDGLTVMFSHLPKGTTVRIQGQEMLTDGDDSIEFDVPGTYAVGLEHFQYMDEVVEVTVE